MMYSWYEAERAWMKQGVAAQEALHMKVVTIVQDPFDRLQSFFGYVYHTRLLEGSAYRSSV